MTLTPGLGLGHQQSGTQPTSMATLALLSDACGVFPSERMIRCWLDGTCSLLTLIGIKKKIASVQQIYERAPSSFINSIFLFSLLEIWALSFSFFFLFYCPINQLMTSWWPLG